MPDRPKIALCFFGIPRALRFTYRSIEERVIAPLQAAGDLSIYGHYFEQTEISNPRSKEFGQLDPADCRLLPYTALKLDPPMNDKVTALYDSVASFGAGWKDDYASLRNLCHQLVSLHEVTQMALEADPDLVVFCRPDLIYHDSFAEIIETALSLSGPAIVTPYWQQHGGLNDRFYIAVGRQAAERIGGRATEARAYCESQKSCLGAEVFLKYVTQGMTLVSVPTRATRIRFDGSRRNENFDCPKAYAAIRRAKKFVRQPGLVEIARHGIRFVQAAACGPRYSDLGKDFRTLSQTPDGI